MSPAEPPRRISLPLELAAMPEPEPELMPPPVVAAADIISTKDGTPIGVVTFEQGADGRITIEGDFNGLGKNSVHALYIHEQGDCARKGQRVGGHLDPTGAKHGPPSSSQRHAGDFGNLIADASGKARFSMITDSVTMVTARPDSVIDRAVVVHVGADNKQGHAGDVLACGVIKFVDAI